MYPLLSLILSIYLLRVQMVWKLSSLVHHGWAQRRKPFGCQRAWSLTETIHDFLKGKSTYYIIMWESKKTKLSHYHYSVDITVHTSKNYKFIRYYNTWYHTYVQCILAETHTDQSRHSASMGEGSSFTVNHQSKHRAPMGIDFISSSKLERRNETI